MATSINLYKKIDKAITAVNRAGGYKPSFWFAPVDTFTLINIPGSVTNIGDRVTVSVDDTFASLEGWIRVDCLLNTVMTKSTSIGDDGALQMEHSGEAVLTGDSATILATMIAMQDDQMLLLVKDQDCTTATDYVRFGDSCLQPVIKVDFDSKDTKSGGAKQYKVTWKIIGHKVFYTGTVTEKP